MSIWSRLERLEDKLVDFSECDNCHGLFRWPHMKRVQEPVRNLVLYCKNCAPKWDRKIYDGENARYFTNRKVEVDEHGKEVKPS